jgi:O-antigen ligase
MVEIAAGIVDHAWVFTTAAGVALALLSFLLGLRESDWSPLIVMASVPVQRELMLGKGDAAITLTQSVLAGFFAAAILRFVSGRLRIRLDSITVLSGTVVALYGLSILAADDVRLWAGETYRWGVAGLFLVLARPYFTHRSRHRVLLVLGGLAIVGALWATAQVWQRSGPPSFSRSGWTRAYGGFGEPNPLAAFGWTVALPLVAFALLYRSRWTLQRTVVVCAAFAGTGTLVLSQSRGGALGCASGLAVLALIWFMRRNNLIRNVAFCALAVAISLVSILVVVERPWNVFETGTTSSNWADQERTAHWSAAVEMAARSPLAGIGAGGFENEYNAYLQIAAEAGVAALVAYLILLGALAGSLVRRARVSSNNWLESGVLAITVALFAHQLVDYLHVLSLGLLFAGLWAAALESGSRGLPFRERDTFA